VALLNLQSALGCLAIVGLAWALSENRRAVRPRTILIAFALQLGVALVLLRVPAARNALLGLNVLVEALQTATRAGTAFVFGYVGGADPPFDVRHPQNVGSLAFQALPLVLVISALSAVLWHWGVLRVLVRAIAWALERTMGIGGAVGLGSAANVFMGNIEAPLLIRPYLARMSRSELFTVFTVGLATVAGTVLFIYATILEPVVPGALGHVIVASIISLPAAIMVSKIMIPSDEVTDAAIGDELTYESSMHALTQGTQDGLRIFLSITAMLLVVVALVALVNYVLGSLPPVAGAPLTLERVLGVALAPFAWLLGLPWAEAATGGALLGTKTMLNEFLAYLQLAGTAELAPRSRLILVYALCGFANPGSVGIMIAGVTALVPERRTEVIELSARALVSGTLSTFLTGAVIGVITAG
jgi:CNT family concentrative nucleoside transporter